MCCMRKVFKTDRRLLASIETWVTLVMRFCLPSAAQRSASLVKTVFVLDVIVYTLIHKSGFFLCFLQWKEMLINVSRQECSSQLS